MYEAPQGGYHASSHSIFMNPVETCITSTFQMPRQAQGGGATQPGREQKSVIRKLMPASYTLALPICPTGPAGQGLAFRVSTKNSTTLLCGL